MVNALTLLFGTLLALVAGLEVVDASRSERDPRRALAACLGLLAAAATRNLLWVYVGFEAFALARARPRVGSLAGSAVSLLGILLVAVSARTSDLAFLEPRPTVLAGVFLLLAGLVMKWLGSRVTPFLCLGAAVALVAVVVRISAWAPEIAAVFASDAGLVAAAAMLAGGVGAALSRTTRSLAFWLTSFTVGLAVVGLGGGPPALPHVLMHVTASVVMIALMLAGAPGAAWLVALSLASVPPFPGFVTKLYLLASFGPWTLAVALSGMALVALGCAFELERAEVSTPAWITFAAAAAVVALGVFPEMVLGAVARAAMSLF